MKKKILFVLIIFLLFPCLVLAKDTTANKKTDKQTDTVKKKTDEIVYRDVGSNAETTTKNVGVLDRGVKLHEFGLSGLHVDTTDNEYLFCISPGSGDTLGEWNVKYINPMDKEHFGAFVLLDYARRKVGTPRFGNCGGDLDECDDGYMGIINHVRAYVHDKKMRPSKAVWDRPGQVKFRAAHGNCENVNYKNTNNYYCVGEKAYDLFDKTPAASASFSRNSYYGDTVEYGDTKFVIVNLKVKNINNTFYDTFGIDGPPGDGYKQFVALTGADGATYHGYTTDITKVKFGADGNLDASSLSLDTRFYKNDTYYLVYSMDNKKSAFDIKYATNDLKNIKGYEFYPGTNVKDKSCDPITGECVYGEQFFLKIKFGDLKSPDQTATIKVPKVCPPVNPFGEDCSNLSEQSNKCEVDAENNKLKCTYSDFDPNQEDTIRNCIVDSANTDLAGNVYGRACLKTSNTCGVFCYESYDFTFPYNFNINAGRYINLNTQIKGTITCVGRAIDADGYPIDGGQSCDISGSKEKLNNQWFNPKLTYSYEEEWWPGDIGSNRGKMEGGTAEVGSVEVKDNSTTLTQTITNSFQTRPIYAVNYPTGEIKKYNSSNPDSNFTKVDGLPISVKTKLGKYNYDIEVSNLGWKSVGDSCVLGRIDQVLNADKKKNGNKKPKKANEYACNYTVGVCKRPPAEGSDEEQYWEDWVYQCEHLEHPYPTLEECWIHECVCEDCPVNTPPTETDPPGDGEECGNPCINVKPNYDFRSISTAKFNPNNRVVGSNWDTSKKDVSLKSYKAAKALEESGYDASEANNTEIINSSDSGNKQPSSSTSSTVSKTGTSNKVVMKFTMTPEVAKEIRDYNSKQKGGYVNTDMTCSNVTVGEETFENIICKSKFLDEFSNQIDDKWRASRNSSSPFNITYDYSNVPGDQKVYTNGYWTIYLVDKNNENNKVKKKNSEILSVGPSWK